MADATTIVDTYLAMWNETDPKRRARLIEQAWVGDGRYADPMLAADGRLERVTGFFGEAPALAAV